MSEGDRIWDAATTLAALGAGGAALWDWTPVADRLELAGASAELGLGPLAPACASAALRALVLPEDRHLADELLALRPEGEPVEVCLHFRNGVAAVWRGRWDAQGRAAGIISAAPGATAGRDALTGLLDRNSFLRHARDRLAAPGAHHLIVADLDRLRRLNEALGHERADLVLAALGTRLAAALPASALVARIGEDEFAALCAAEAAPTLVALRRGLERPLSIAGFEIHPKLSLGLVAARGGDDAVDAAELLRRAELELEAGKATRGVATTRLSTDGVSRLALESELEGAIDRYSHALHMLFVEDVEDAVIPEDRKHARMGIDRKR